MSALRSLGLRLALLLVASIPASAQERPRPGFVPGEVVVKFVPGSTAGRLVAEAGKGAGAADRSLAEYVTALSKEVDVPLAPKRLGSGGSLVVGIDLGRLTAQAGEGLEKDPRVLGVVRPEGSPPALEVRLARPPASLAELVESFSKDVGLPLEARPEGEDRLRITLDARAVTREVVARLSRRPDVEHAQPNYVARRLTSPG